MVNTAILYRELQVVTSQASPSFVPSSEELQSGTKLVRKEAKGEQPVSFIMNDAPLMHGHFEQAHTVRQEVEVERLQVSPNPRNELSLLCFGIAMRWCCSFAVISSKGRSLGLERGARGCRYETLLLAYGLFTVVDSLGKQIPLDLGSMWCQGGCRFEHMNETSMEPDNRLTFGLLLLRLALSDLLNRSSYADADWQLYSLSNSGKTKLAEPELCGVAPALSQPKQGLFAQHLVSIVHFTF